MAERLYGVALGYAQLGGFERVYDLYCGIGTIALLAAPRAAQVWGLELSEDAVADAIRASLASPLVFKEESEAKTRLFLTAVLGGTVIGGTLGWLATAVMAAAGSCRARRPRPSCAARRRRVRAGTRSR